LLRLLQKRLRDLAATLAVRFAFHMACGAMLGMKRVFELMISTRLAEQILNGRRRVIGWRCVDSDDTLLAVQLESGSEFQSGATLRVHSHEVEAIRRNLNHELLQGATISAREE
jgi:hypothetical protein